MKIRKIAILTSGGDAPGMNTVIWAIVNCSQKKGIETYVVYDGYKGLAEGNIQKITSADVDTWVKKGGTKIYSTRYPEFKDEAVRKIAKEQLDKHNIDALVVIGGDGTFIGAKLLSELGVKTVGIPGTIDNDIPTTDLTIGYITAIETVTDALEKIRDTLESHNRAAIIEVMGRYSGALALSAAIVTGAEGLSIPERKLTEEEIIETIKQARNNGHRSIIVVVTEKLYDVKALANKIQELTGIETRGNILGHLQRGGSPAPSERILAVRMGVFAVKQLIEGKTGITINSVNSKMVAIPIEETVTSERTNLVELLEQYDLVK